VLPLAFSRVARLEPRASFLTIHNERLDLKLMCFHVDVRLDLHVRLDVTVTVARIGADVHVRCGHWHCLKGVRITVSHGGL
jgi:hypothetical protein